MRRNMQDFWIICDADAKGFHPDDDAFEDHHMQGQNTS